MSFLYSFLATAPTLDIDSPFDMATTATYVAGAAAAVLALTLGYRVGFRYIKKVIGSISKG